MTENILLEVRNKYGAWKERERVEVAKAAYENHTRGAQLSLRSSDRLDLAVDILERYPQVSVRGIAEVMCIDPSSIVRRKQKLRKGRD